MNLVALTGLFGMAIAKMGMLSTTAYVLTMDMFGPIAYNAGGMVEMSQQKVLGRSMIFLIAYMDEVTTFAQEPFKQVDIVIRKKEDYLLREYKERPDYGRCVVIIASAYLRAIIKPGALDHIINTGWIRKHDCLVDPLNENNGLSVPDFRILLGHPLLGAKIVAVLLMFVNRVLTFKSQIKEKSQGKIYGEMLADTTSWRANHQKFAMLSAFFCNHLRYCGRHMQRHIFL
ncbi:hypothetical protein ACOSQ3_021702 [Xanthoceras sorbifolium]